MKRIRPTHFLSLVLLSVLFTLSAYDLSSVTDELIDNTFSLTISSA